MIVGFQPFSQHFPSIFLGAHHCPLDQVAVKEEMNPIAQDVKKGQDRDP
jgi:hypothetical protein